MSDYAQHAVIEGDPSIVDSQDMVKKTRRIQAHQKRMQAQQQDIEETTVGKQQSAQGSQDHSTRQGGTAYKQQLRQYFKKSKFQWAQDKKGVHIIQPKTKDATVAAPKTVKKAADKIVNFLGYKIDMSARLSEYKESYQKWLIEARHANILLAAYAKVKYGMLQYILSLLGVNADELQKLQEEALGNAKAENDILYAQNEYNVELLTIFSSQKKDKKKLRTFNRIKAELKLARKRLGDDGYFDGERGLLIKEEQIKKIMNELVEEQQRLQFLKDFV